MGFNCVLLSNIFLSASLITLAKIHVGCIERDVDNGNIVAVDDICDKRVYGFKPSSLMTNIAALSGVLAAFLLPFIGAIVDYTRHRKLIGCIAAVVIMTVQAVQIGTVEATWFTMAILQALNGFFTAALRVVAFAYLPEIQRIVGDEVMPRLNARFLIWGSWSQLLYLVVVAGIGLLLKTFNDDVVIAQIGQGADVILSGVFFALAFYFFTKKEARRELPEKSFLLFAGFKQVFCTSRGIWKHYRSTLGWFFLAVLFGRTGK